MKETKKKFKAVKAAADAANRGQNTGAEKDVMMELMMLGAVIVGTFPEGANIVARGLAEIERLRKQVAKLQGSKTTPSNKKTTKPSKITRR